MDLIIYHQYLDEHGKNLKYIGLDKMKRVFLFEWINPIDKKCLIRRSIEPSMGHKFTLIKPIDNTYLCDTDGESLSDNE